MIRKILERPAPLWLVELQPNTITDLPNTGPLEELIGPWFYTYQFRGVPLDRLHQVLTSGVDVEPPDSPIYVSTFDKAWEYGGSPRLIFGLDYRNLRLSHKEIPADTPPEEIEILREQYPTMLLSKNGKKRFLSRLEAGDRRIATSYEISYCRWIQKNQLGELRAVFVFYEPEDREKVETHVGEVVEELVRAVASGALLLPNPDASHSEG